jgi:hypothetical protein
MWAWGTDIFQSEDAWDLRQAYLLSLARGDNGPAAAALLAARFQPGQASSHETFWPALAASQAEAGRLGEDVRARALEVILDGSAIGEWERAGAAAAEIRRHAAALEQLRVQLERASPPAVAAPRPLAARRRVRAMLAPYWRRMTPQAQRVAAELAQIAPRDVASLRAARALLPRDQVWLVVAQAARAQRWHQAFCAEVIAESHSRLAQRGIGEDTPLTASLDRAVRDNLQLLARFRADHEQATAFLQAVWQLVDDDPKPLRPPSYPASLEGGR